MAINQCAHFFNNPLLVHKRTVRKIAKYLASTSTYMDLPDGNQRLNICGVVYNNDIEKCTECYVDADFSGGWAQADADNAEKIISRTRYVITYAVCPVL